MDETTQEFLKYYKNLFEQKQKLVSLVSLKLEIGYLNSGQKIFPPSILKTTTEVINEIDNIYLLKSICSYYIMMEIHNYTMRLLKIIENPIDLISLTKKYPE